MCRVVRQALQGSWFGVAAALGYFFIASQSLTADKYSAMANVHVAKDKAGVGVAVATWLAEQAEIAIAAKGSFTVAFSGGSLPAIAAHGLEDETLKAQCQPERWQVSHHGQHIWYHWQPTTLS